MIRWRAVRGGAAAAALVVWAGGASCAPGTSPDSAGDEIPAMSEIARQYVDLVLAVGEHDDGYVDAYYGPAEWREAIRATPPALAEIALRAAAARTSLAAQPEAGSEMEALRVAYLDRQLEALEARVAMLDGETFDFDTESQKLYDAVAPHHPDEYFEALVERLDALLPGEGSVVERYNAFRGRFVIPSDRLDSVFQQAIAECRRRTHEHLELPADESFRLEYVTDKPWSGYNWFQGGHESLIQVNTELPIELDRAIDLACHEGYPGHHTYNVLLESHLVEDRGWIEYSVYPLFSPQSLIAEGSANYGIEVAFPGDERTEFERDVLAPLAGLDPHAVETYAAVRHAAEGLSYAGNEAARRYLNGEIDAAQASAWLERYALSSRERAAQRIRFYDAYRSYVINYNLGRDLVRAWVERGDPSSDERWARFADLISSPRLPSGLR
jgi:hypothetical protein